jgi:DNA (cytosine-5)-methyltransferase 1
MTYRLLDLFCGAGGAAMGYHRAGFEVVGVDIKPQKHFPFEFHEDDALSFLVHHGKEYDAIHASPPCQAFSMANYKDRTTGRCQYTNLIPDTRDLLQVVLRPWIIENVPTAPLIDPIMLCGTMFGLGVFRHRHFETSFPLIAPAHAKHDGKIGDGKYFSVAGGSGRWKSWGTVKRNITKGSIADWRKAMGVDWMVMGEIQQAIPPAYTEWIGRQLMDHLNGIARMACGMEGRI